MESAGVGRNDRGATVHDGQLRQTWSFLPRIIVTLSFFVLSSSCFLLFLSYLLFLILGITSTIHLIVF